MAPRGTPHRPLPSDFGDKTWVDVQTKLARWVRANYPRVDYDLLEDALQDVILDGMTYWQSLDSSHTGDPQKNFDYAVFRGKQYLGRHIQGLARDRADSTSFDVMDGAWDRADDAPGPEEVALGLDEEQRARAVLAELSPEDLHNYFDNVLSDESGRETATRTGTSQSTVNRRRAAQRLQLQSIAREFGLNA